MSLGIGELRGQCEERNYLSGIRFSNFSAGSTLVGTGVALQTLLRR